MKMVTVILGPDSAERVLEALEGQGLEAMTRVGVRSRGRDTGCPAGSLRDFEVPKEMIMALVDDERLPHIVSLIRTHAQKGDGCRKSGCIREGKILVTDVLQEVTIRTMEREENPSALPSMQQSGMNAAVRKENA